MNLSYLSNAMKKIFDKMSFHRHFTWYQKDFLLNNKNVYWMITQIVVKFWCVEVVIQGFGK